MPLGAEDVQLLTSALAEALRHAVSQATTDAANAFSSQRVQNDAAPTKIPAFKMEEYKQTDMSSVETYFQRFDLALNLSKIPAEDFRNYSRVHMGAHLNEALRFLLHPRKPEDITYEEIKTILIHHFENGSH